MLQLSRSQIKKILSLVGLVLWTFLGTSCVSVNIAQPKSNKADGANYTAPAKPFESISTENADHAWQSSATGNTISYVSECNSSAESQLKSLESENLNSLNQLQILSSESKFFDERESVESLAHGFVDGIPVKMALLIYKKNSCNFTLSFVGRKAKFESEAKIFDQFKKSFSYQVGAP